MLIRMVSHVPAARRVMAENAEEVNINYRNSPIAVGPRLRRAKVVAGEHLPHVADAAVQKQLSAVCGPDNTGHVVLTCDVDRRPGGPRRRRSRSDAGAGHGLRNGASAPVAGYDVVVADPNGVVAQRFGLKNGGRVVVRPDGYIGAVAALDDTTTVADYFAKVRS